MYIAVSGRVADIRSDIILKENDKKQTVKEQCNSQCLQSHVSLSIHSLNERKEWERKRRHEYIYIYIYIYAFINETETNRVRK